MAANLQELVESKANLVDYFYNDTVSQFHRSRTDLFARMNLIEREYSNWRDEHVAAHEACILANQSHHMPVLFVSGPDARDMLQSLTPISFEGLTPERAKQYFALTPRGRHIGDCIMHYYGEEGGFELISSLYLLNWVRFQGESGHWNVRMELDMTTPFNPTGKRRKFRFELEGPNARKVLDEVTEGGFPELKFFRVANVKIAGVPVMALRHGMGQSGGAELSGPYAELDKVRDAILKAGENYGIRLAGTITYFSNSVVSGWIPYPLPAIYTDDELRSYREWLPANGWEGNVQLAGSLYTNNIEDYYWTPSGLGYDRLIKFDHPFVGREALEAAQSKPRRVKRTLRWHPDDIMKVYESQFRPGPRYKAIDLPTPMYGWPQADEVRTTDGKLIGMSQYCGYSAYESDLLSHACIDEAHAELGTEVVLTWGEVNGGSRKSFVDRHEQTTIRATLCKSPYKRGGRATQQRATL